MSYEWRGEIYETQQAVAEAAGCHVNTIYRHLERFGNLDQLRPGVRGNLVRVELDGRVWSSRIEFAKYVNSTPLTVYNWVLHGRIDLMRAALARAEARKAP